MKSDPENGFLVGEIRFRITRISRSISKSEIRISQSNATLICDLMYVLTVSSSLVPGPDLATRVSRGGLELKELEFSRSA